MVGLELRVSTQDTTARGFFRRLADILEATLMSLIGN